MRRIGTDEDMAGAAIFLASRASDYVVGDTLVVDSGLVNAALGTSITIIEGRDTLMGFLDGEMSKGLVTALERGGHQVMLGDAVLSIERVAGGPLRLALKSGKRLEVDKVLYSAGRAGNTRGLGLDRASALRRRESGDVRDTHDCTGGRRLRHGESAV